MTDCRVPPISLNTTQLPELVFRPVEADLVGVGIGLARQAGEAAGEATGEVQEVQLLHVPSDRRSSRATPAGQWRSEASRSAVGAGRTPREERRSPAGLHPATAVADQQDAMSNASCAEEMPLRRVAMVSSPSGWAAIAG